MKVRVMKAEETHKVCIISEVNVGDKQLLSSAYLRLPLRKKTLDSQISAR